MWKDYVLVEISLGMWWNWWRWQQWPFLICSYVSVSLIFWRDFIALIRSFLSVKSLCERIAYRLRYCLVCDEIGGDGGSDLFWICSYLSVSLIFWRDFVALIRSFLVVKSSCERIAYWLRYHLVCDKIGGDGDGDLFWICSYLSVSLVFWQDFVVLIRSFLSVKSLCERIAYRLRYHLVCDEIGGDGDGDLFWICS